MAASIFVYLTDQQHGRVRAAIARAQARRDAAGEYGRITASDFVRTALMEAVVRDEEQAAAAETNHPLPAAGLPSGAGRAKGGAGGFGAPPPARRRHAAGVVRRKP